MPQNMLLSLAAPASRRQLMLLRVLPQSAVDRAHGVAGRLGELAREHRIRPPEIERVPRRLFAAQRPESAEVQYRIGLPIAEVQQDGGSGPVDAREQAENPDLRPLVAGAECELRRIADLLSRVRRAPLDGAGCLPPAQRQELPAPQVPTIPHCGTDLVHRPVLTRIGVPLCPMRDLGCWESELEDGWLHGAPELYSRFRRTRKGKQR